ncbi:MAG: hypothetical protein JXB38_16320 [Anaerolineales bacterium]|nr:hypothetical protein [Anaerolineales bacterium]
MGKLLLFDKLSDSPRIFMCPPPGELRAFVAAVLTAGHSKAIYQLFSVGTGRLDLSLQKKRTEILSALLVYS